MLQKQNDTMLRREFLKEEKITKIKRQTKMKFFLANLIGAKSNILFLSIYRGLFKKIRK